jgi:hypothetical protein
MYAEVVMKGTLRLFLVVIDITRENHVDVYNTYLICLLHY